MLSPYNHAMKLYYKCIYPPIRESIANRWEVWLISGSTLTLKASYDFVWSSAGGVVGSDLYNYSLSMFGSTVQTFTNPDGSTIDVVSTPASTLATFEQGYIAGSDILNECPLIR